MKDLQTFREEVIADFNEHRRGLTRRAQELVPEVTIRKVELTGSYATGYMTEDSDIDLRVFYSGELTPEAVANKLYGHLSGIGGVYDIIPRRKN